MSTPAARKWLDKQWWPLLGITGITVASMGVWWRRKASADPELRSPDSRAITGGLPQDPAGGVVEAYGRKSAEQSGLMEGDRAFQGIFPTKKLVEKADQLGVLPSSQEKDP